MDMGSLVGLRMESERIDNATVVVDLRGELDTFTAARAKSAMRSLATEGYRHLVLNLHWLDFIDSTGLSVLIGALRDARELGGSIRLVAPVHHIRKIFEITRLTYAFPIDASIEDALFELRREAFPPQEQLPKAA